MKNYLYANKIHEIKSVSILILALFFIISFGGTPASSQGMGMKKAPSPRSKQTLTDQISEIRSKLLHLESALEREHRGKSETTSAMTGNMGMQKMGPMGKMKHPSMSGGNKKGMGMMGRMNEKRGHRLPSSLPGFPGMSHIYHIGSTGFFLDYSKDINLSIQQITALNKIKEQITLKNSTVDRKIQGLEQDLWTLTSSDLPEINKIDEKIRAIERLKGEIRLAFIRAVGKAAKVLSPEQLNKLKGMNQDPI